MASFNALLLNFNASQCSEPPVSFNGPTSKLASFGIVGLVGDAALLTPQCQTPRRGAQSSVGSGSLQSYPFLVSAMRTNSVRGPSWVAPVRIHAGHAALCNLEAAAAQAGWVSFAKVASIFTQPRADAGST